MLDIQVCLVIYFNYFFCCPVSTAYSSTIVLMKKAMPSVKTMELASIESILSPVTVQMGLLETDVKQMLMTVKVIPV